MVEVVDERSMRKDWVVLRTLFVEDGPVLPLLSRQGEVVCPKVGSIKEDSAEEKFLSICLNTKKSSPEHWMVSVRTIIGDEALMFATSLEAIVSSEWLPPNENRDSRVGRTPSPTL